MTEQNQEVKLEDRLYQLGAVNQIARALDKKSKPSERFQLYDTLAQLTSDGDPGRYREHYGDIRTSPEEAARYAFGNIGKRTHEIKELYEKEKEKILNEVTGVIASHIKNSKSKGEAASILGQYLRGIFKIPELDQVTADSLAQQESAEAAGVKFNYTARGSIEEYRSSYESLHARLAASDFLSDIKDKDGKITGYELNADKIKELMGNVEQAAVIYKNSKDIQIKKMQEEQAKKNLK